MYFDFDDVRGLLRGAGLVTFAIAIGLFASSLPSDGGMRKDRGTGRVYFIEKEPADPVMRLSSLAVGGLSAVLLSASLCFPKKPNHKAEANSPNRGSSS